MTRRPRSDEITDDSDLPDSGSGVVGVVALMPAVILLFGLLLVGGRLRETHSTVEHAAQDAARAASLDRTQADAARDATNVATAELASGGLACRPAATVTAALTDRLQGGGFNAPVGTATTVSVTVTCNIGFRDLGVRGVGNRRVRFTAISPLDTYRSRS